MSDFSTINQFRKTTQLRKINEDPTYLSFFFLFNFYDREHSPLLSGTASDYLRNVVGDDERADRLDRFVKLLQKINTELPWFWQSISGLEATRQYGKLEDPWWGAEERKLEIECLENIELTSYALIDLYKRAAYDFNRWVEVIPKNLRHFELTVFVTEVRTFQQTTTDNVKDSRGNYGQLGDSSIGSGKSVNQSMSVDAKPIVVTKLGHCEFDIESTNDLFADLSKNPEMATSKIGIFWHTTEQINQLYGQNLNANEGNSLVLEAEPNNLEPNNPFDPSADTRKVGVDNSSNNVFPEGKKQNTLNEEDEDDGLLNNLGAAARQKLGSVVDDVRDSAIGAVENVTNILDGLPGSNGSLGNVHGSLLTGQLGQLANSAVEGALARLLLGNVHGVNNASSIQDAINSGSLNAIANAAGQLFGSTSLSGLLGDSSNSITPKKVYSENVIDSSQGPINERVYEPAVDSTPDGNLNQNVHG